MTLLESSSNKRVDPEKLESMVSDFSGELDKAENHLLICVQSGYGEKVIRACLQNLDYSHEGFDTLVRLILRAIDEYGIRTTLFINKLADLGQSYEACILPGFYRGLASVREEMVLKGIFESPLKPIEKRITSIDSSDLQKKKKKRRKKVTYHGLLYKAGVYKIDGPCGLLLFPVSVKPFKPIRYDEARGGIYQYRKYPNRPIHLYIINEILGGYETGKHASGTLHTDRLKTHIDNLTGTDPLDDDSLYKFMVELCGGSMLKYGLHLVPKIPVEDELPRRFDCYLHRFDSHYFIEYMKLMKEEHPAFFDSDLEYSYAYPLGTPKPTNWKSDLYLK